MVSDLFELSKATLNGLLVSGLHALAQYVECSESIDHAKTCQGIVDLAQICSPC